jgi:MoxR-like ATPase
MDRIKAGKPTIELAIMCYRAGRPLLLWGRHGIGKTEILETAANDLEIRYISRDLSLMEPTDLTGLPKIDGATTKYLPPDFLPTSGSGLLVFEELNRCDRYVRTPCLQLLTARRLNDYVLPAGWLPMAAVNPDDENYEVFGLDSAFTSRFVQATLVPDQAEWLAWAERANINSAVVNYVASDATIFDSPDSNPRAWKGVSDVLWAAGNESVDRTTLRAAIVGLVGDQRGIAFLRSLERPDQPLTADDILTRYSRHRAAVREWIAAGRLDLVKGTLLNIKRHLQPQPDFDEVRADDKRWKNLGAFFQDLPGDLRTGAQQWFRERAYNFPLAAARRSNTA